MDTFEADLSKAMSVAKRAATHILRNYPNDVDDVLQNAQIKAWRFRENFRGQAQFRTYFCRIVINEALMHIRKEVARTHNSLEEPLELDGEKIVVEPPTEAPTPERLAYASEIWETITTAISKMPSARKQEAKLFVLGDIASSVAARKARRFKVRHDLKKVLLERGICAAFI